MRERVTTGFLNNNDGIILITSNNTTGLEPHIYQVDTLTNDTHFTAHAVHPNTNNTITGHINPGGGLTITNTGKLKKRILKAAGIGANLTNGEYVSIDDITANSRLTGTVSYYSTNNPAVEHNLTENKLTYPQATHHFDYGVLVFANRNQILIDDTLASDLTYDVYATNPGYHGYLNHIDPTLIRPATREAVEALQKVENEPGFNPADVMLLLNTAQEKEHETIQARNETINKAILTYLGTLNLGEENPVVTEAINTLLKEAGK